MPSSAPALRLTVDGRPHHAPAGQTLAGLLADWPHAPDAVATALNGRFVPRERRAATVLADGDAITLIRPIEGG